MRISPKRFMHGLLYAAPILLLALASCGGGGGGGTTTPPVVAPSTPTGIIATDVTNCSYRIQVSWNPVTGATGYNIYRDTASSVQTTTPLNGSSPVATNAYTDTSPASNTTYYYKITAVNSAGPSSPSAAAYAATPATTNTCVNVGGSVQGSTLAASTQVTTFAGRYPFPGSADGPASTAQFNSPTAIATDGVNLYIADKDNDVIRKIDILSGTVSTVAGIVLSPGNAESPAPQFDHPDGITIDPTGLYLYVSDTVNGSIRKIDLSTTPATVSTLAASIGVGGVPRGITIDRNGNLYVADVFNNSIVRVATSNGSLSTVANGTLSSPVGITTDGTTLYVTETGNSKLSTIDIATNALASGVASGFNIPQGITSDGTNLYVTNSGDHTVDKVVIGGLWTKSLITGTAGSPGYNNGPVATALFNTPTGITTDGTNLYVVDTANSVIRKIQ